MIILIKIEMLFDNNVIFNKISKCNKKEFFLIYKEY